MSAPRWQDAHGPTRAGWWWGQWPSGSHIRPEVAEVFDDMMATSASWGHEVPVTEVTWLAPIPGPAILAALARYAEALDDLDALWDGADFITRNNVTNLAHAAGDALHDAIRAERDGAA